MDRENEIGEIDAEIGEIDAEIGEIDAEIGDYLTISYQEIIIYIPIQLRRFFDE